MFKSVVDFNGETRNVSFFEDDTVGVVRQQIAKSVDIHPDRLFINVIVKLEKDYYTSDSRNWEVLFNRISLNGRAIEKEPFYAYCESRGVSVPYTKLDRDDWMANPEFLQPLYDPGTSFEELRIFGVEVAKAYSLPLKFDTRLASMIPTAQQPIPDDGRLFISLYPTLNISRFVIKEFGEGSEGAYFPLLRSSTPQRLSEQQIQNLDANTKQLKDILSLDPPPPKEVHILKASWRADFVDTDFGKAVRTRFEQIFYGLTVSEEIPCITFFTGRSEVSRHKFYKTDAQSKKTYLELPIWAAWWTKSKPYRPNLSALILYRGKDRERFDRVTITAHDIILAAYRDSTNTETLDELRDGLMSWFMTFDAVIPFLNKSDIVESRFVLQDNIKFKAEYSSALDSYDMLRMNCLSGIFEASKKSQQVFKFLRCDNADNGINPRDVFIINLLKEDPFIKPSEIEEELKLTPEEATLLLDTIKARVEEDPSLLTRQFRSFPGLIVHQKTIEVTDVDSIDRFLQYSNILRYILSDPKTDAINRICPKKQESAPIAVSTVNTEFVDTEFSNLFDYLEGDVLEEKKATPQVTVKTNTSKSSTIYNYFNIRLQEFDPVTFPSQSAYAKLVDQNLQPVVISDKEIQEIMKVGPEFSPSEYPDNQKIVLKNPDGVLMCPDYWCMYDKIPLRADQLEEVEGTKVCPLCHGKIRKPSDYKADTREYPVIPRTKGNSYPVYKDNNPSLPICLKSSKGRKLKKADQDDKYYILSETKNIGYGRFAYLPRDLLNSIHIQEEYKIAIEAGNRIQTGMSGFFRVGLGRPSEGLPSFLDVHTKIPSPRHNVVYILRCAFLATWTMTSDEHVSEIEEYLVMKPFNEDPVVKRHVAKVISSIDKAFVEGRLTVAQELEYCAISLAVDLYRINLNDLTIGCTFYTPQVKRRSRGMIILQRGSDVDCLCHVARQQKKFVFKANIFEAPFKIETFEELAKKRNKACITYIPSFGEAIIIAKDILGKEEFSIILDPFGRAQALYFRGEFILPFQNTPIPPIIKSIEKISGYQEVKELPSHDDMIGVLKKAAKKFSGYEYAEDMYDGEGNVVEILLRSGLRIPVQPTKGQGEASQVTHTIMEEGESTLAFGEPDAKNLQRYKEISYTSELYEFLLYQLTMDIQDSKFPDLFTALLETAPKRKELEPELEDWFDQTTHFVSLDTPIEFLSKIRKPCGQFKKKECDSAHMCAWNGKQCRIQVRDTVSKKKIFNKLLGTLLDNSKIRSIVVDGRATPFFSTVLYLQLPTEIIYTDTELKETIYAQ